MRGLQAAFKRQEREARKRQRELQRLAKEQAKLSALDQARLEVEANENAIELLLSMHKEQNPAVDWPELAVSLPPHRPQRLARHEFAALLNLAGSLGRYSAESQAQLTGQAEEQDDRDHEAALARHAQAFETWQWLQGLSCRVLSGERDAYEEVVEELSPLGEIASLGSKSSVVVHGPKLVACELLVNGRDVVPTELKSLTGTGKLRVKAMPKARFHEIYQDYVCGCALRCAREIFAILPVETVLVTARLARTDTSEDLGLAVAVLSVAIGREACSKLDFETLDASETVATFPHRGDVKASKKAGEFVGITPFLPADVAAPGARVDRRTDLRPEMQMLRGSIRSQLGLPSLHDAYGYAADRST